ncbi:MAG TPA: hypothetical protein ENJ28_11640 [Gammaproteobacteria bacterium]|nr:hypothetical protein [Gammaproteobacteria bacterium]
MIEEYFSNSNLKHLKYLIVAFGLLPVALLIGGIVVRPEDDKVINMLLYISAVVFVLCVLVLLWLSAFPKYFFHIKNKTLYLPDSSFYKWGGKYLKFELTNLVSSIIEPSSEDRYDLIILIKSVNSVKSVNMVLGHLSITNEGGKAKISIFNLKKGIATKWLNKLNSRISASKTTC